MILIKISTYETVPTDTYTLFIYVLGLFLPHMSHRNGPATLLVFHPTTKQWKYNLKYR